MERSGWRGRERLQRTGSGAARKGIASPVSKPVSRASDRGSGEGNGLLRKGIYSSKMVIDSNCGDNFPDEKTSLALGYRPNPCKKVNGTPIKTLINEEMSKELKTRQSAPSLVARLMGLDSLPSSKVNKPHAGMESCFSHGSSVGYQGKHASCEEHSFRMSIDENQDFKDVFEIVEMKKSEESKNQSVQKVISSPQRSETDVAFIRQKFMDAKRLSTNESLQKSKEFDDALEVLDSNKDLFLKFLQEPNSLFSKHLQGVKCAQLPPHASHITILKSAKETKHRNSEVCLKSEINTERYGHMHKEDIAYLGKPATDLLNHSLREHGSPVAHKLSKSDYMGRNNVCSHPTRIVVLKPSLEMTQNKARNLLMPRSPEDIQYGYERPRNTRRLGIQELHAEGRAWQKSSNNVVAVGHRIKGSREIAREITEQMRHSMSNSRKNVANSRFNSNSREERPRRRTEVVKPQVYQWSPSHFHSVDNDSVSSSSSNSTETSVTREARKRLSERWKITKRSQQVEIIEKAPGTLGEMLARPDREMAIKPRFIIQREKRQAKYEAIERQGNPSGISSKDGWKEGCSRKLERSISLPTSTVYGIPKLSARHKAAAHGNCYMLKDVLNLEPDDSSEETINQRRLSSRRGFKHRRNKPPQLDSSGAKSVVLEKEIHVNLELPKDNVDATLLSEPFEGTVPDKGHLVDDFLAPRANSSSLVANEELMNKLNSCEVLNEEFSSLDQNDIKREETSYHQTEPVIPSDHNLTELGSPVSSKEAEQPSPVSVLECPTEEISSSGCFESVSADLKELRMQLRLLKLESSDAYAEESETNFSDADDEHCHPLTDTAEILLAFEGEDDRDFSYLLDVLNDLGVHEAERDRLSDTCYTREYPARSNVFDNLEKKYCIVKSWSRSERKQLFDIINSVLAEIAESIKDQHAWVKPKRGIGPIMCSPDCLVEKVWQMVVKYRKDSESNLDKVLELKWFHLAEDIDIVGIKLESMLKDELFEELVSDLMLAA